MQLTSEGVRMTEIAAPVHKTRLRARMTMAALSATALAFPLAGCGASPEQTGPQAAPSTEANGAPAAGVESTAPTAPEDINVAARHRLEEVAARIIAIAARGNSAQRKVVLKPMDVVPPHTTPRDSVKVTVGPVAEGGKKFRYVAEVGVQPNTPKPYTAGSASKAVDAQIGKIPAEQPETDEAYQSAWAGYDQEGFGLQFTMWGGSASAMPTLYAANPGMVTSATKPLTAESLGSLADHANMLLTPIEQVQ
jgi:hypothetical protein